MLRLALALRFGLSESSTVTVKSEVPVAVGVPEITPVLALIDSPAGKLPLVMLQVYGCAPPAACTVEPYAVPTLPLGSEVVVIARSASMVMLNAAVAVPAAESVTFTVKVEVPTVVGVPEMTPVLAFRDNAADSAPALILQV
jgi:hypothetical protein